MIREALVEADAEEHVILQQIQSSKIHTAVILEKQCDGIFIVTPLIVATKLLNTPLESCII